MSLKVWRSSAALFYNRLLRCFGLVDLKLGRLTHQDLGQMQAGRALRLAAAERIESDRRKTEIECRLKTSPLQSVIQPDGKAAVALCSFGLSV